MTHSVQADRTAGAGAPPEQGSTAVWRMALACLVLGLVSAVMAWFRSFHMVETVLGLLSLPLGAWAQMVSTHTNQRWAAIIGLVAGGFGLGMGIGHGGF